MRLPVAGSIAGLEVEASPGSDAGSALTSWGYKAQEASQMVRLVATEGLTTEEIIKTALQSMVKK